MIRTGTPAGGASLSVVAIPAGPRRRGGPSAREGGGHRGSPSSSTKIHKECTHDAQSPVCRVHADPGSPCRPRSRSRRRLPPPAPGRVAGPGRRRGRRRDRRGALRAHAGAHQQAQRQAPQDGGHHRRRGRARHPQASDRIVLPVPAPPAQAGGQGPVRRDLPGVDRGGLHPQGLATSSRPWATSRGSPGPRSQGSARTSTRACTSSRPAAWTAPGSPTCSSTPPTWT